MKKVKTKICTKCEGELPATIEYFHKQKHCKYGVRNKCKDCRREDDYKIKLQVISHYGGRCAVCGEATLAFLTIDHIEGEGRKHINKIVGGGFYRWLIKNNFPPGYQVLCFNHNWIKYISEARLNMNSSNKSRNTRNWFYRLKQKIINFYGGKCKICNETNVDILSVDHINGGGTQHRNCLGNGGRKIYLFLIKEGFPSGYQILCLNHNCSKNKLNI